MPIVETYRDIGIHDFQDKERIETVVKPEIDAVFAMRSMSALYDYADDWLKPPEARLLAADRYRAMNEERARTYGARPGNLVELAATVAGLRALEWANGPTIGTNLEPVGPGRDPRPPRSVHQQLRLAAAQSHGHSFR